MSPEGPVGQNGIVQPGDHLVEVNSQEYSVTIQQRVYIRVVVNSFDITSPVFLK